MTDTLNGCLLFRNSSSPSSTVNKVADALSRRHTLLTVMAIETLGFEEVKVLLRTDDDFGPIMNVVESKECFDYVLEDGYLFRGDSLCIPKTSLRLLIVQELHNQGHIGKDKTT